MGPVWYSLTQSMSCALLHYGAETLMDFHHDYDTDKVAGAGLEPATYRL